MVVQSIPMIYNVFQPRMLPTVTRNVTFACTGVARRAPAGGEAGGRGREEKRKEVGEEELGRGCSRIGRDGSRTRCAANAIKIYRFIDNPVFCLCLKLPLDTNPLSQDERTTGLVCCKGKTETPEKFRQQ